MIGCVGLQMYTRTSDRQENGVLKTQRFRDNKQQEVVARRVCRALLTFMRTINQNKLQMESIYYDEFQFIYYRIPSGSY
jgi:hypothetical protein